MATLKVEGVRKAYPTPAGPDMAVLKDVSFTAGDGEFLAIVGPSGCGKTTFLRVLDGLAGADGGSIALDGRPVAGPGPDRGFVFQSDSLLPWRTVADNIGFGLELQRRDRAAARRAVSELVRLVGLEGFERYYPHQLSGGMRQRVNLARALAIDPAVLLMDEPFAALDAQTRELMQAELLRIWNAARKTVLFVTHQIDEAVFLSDRVVVMARRPGRIIADITIELPRPRALEMKRTPRFAEYEEQIWRLIAGDVQNAAKENADG